MAALVADRYPGDGAAVQGVEQRLRPRGAEAREPGTPAVEIRAAHGAIQRVEGDQVRTRPRDGTQPRARIAG